MNRFVGISIAVHLLFILLFFIIKPSDATVMEFSTSQVIEIEFVDMKEMEPVKKVIEKKVEPVVGEKKIEPKPEEKKEPVVEERVIKRNEEKVLAEKKIVEERTNKKENKVEEKKPVKQQEVVKEVVKEVAKPTVSGAAAEQASFNDNLYLSEITRKIKMKFKPPHGNEYSGMIAIIYFEIDKLGNISGYKFETKAQNDLINRSAMRAVQELQMRPLPPEYLATGENKLSIHFSFVVK